MLWTDYEEPEFMDFGAEMESKTPENDCWQKTETATTQRCNTNTSSCISKMPEPNSQDTNYSTNNNGNNKRGTYLKETENTVLSHSLTWHQPNSMTTLHYKHFP